MEALRRSAPMPITFEAMAADTDGYFSADHQKIAIRQGMSEEMCIRDSTVLTGTPYKETENAYIIRTQDRRLVVFLPDGKTRCV